MHVAHHDLESVVMKVIDDILQRLQMRWLLQRAVQKVMKRSLSDAPLQIVFNLFDANQDGNLAATELVTVCYGTFVAVCYNLHFLCRRIVCNFKPVPFSCITRW